MSGDTLADLSDLVDLCTVCLNPKSIETNGVVVKW